MIGPTSSLADICYAVAAALDQHLLPGVLTGGSAAALYAPHAYMSEDADFVLDGDPPLTLIATALATIGYRREGRSRIFLHESSAFTVDFPKGPLAVGADYIFESATFERGGMLLRVLSRTDSIRDRLAHYYYWNDFTALNAAVGVAASAPSEVDFDLIARWTERESPALLAKYAEFRRRLAES